MGAGRSIVVPALCVVLSAGILIFDLTIPLGVAAGVAYAVVVLLALESRSPPFVVGTAVATSGLTGAGFAFSDPGGIEWMVSTNRGLSLLVIWSTAFIGLRRLRAERATVQNEAHLSAVVESAVDGIITIDGEGNILSVNRAVEDMFGYPARALLGQNVKLLMPSPDHERHDGHLARYQATGKAGLIGRTRELEGRREDGSTFPLELSVADATVSGRRMYVGILHDIGERKAHLREMEAKQAQLERANAELEAFSYSVSHDLRAPLRAIDGFARAFEEDYAAAVDDEGRRFLAVIRTNARKMGTLIDDLLAFSRMSRRVVEHREIDMGALARQALGDLIGGEDRRIDVHIGELPRASGDEAMIRQVWVNLLGNAIKYTRPREHARIEVEGQEKEDEVVYSVVDNGVGFDNAYVGKLFGVFQRLHRDTEFEGTGVGLALVQRIVARHGGAVSAEGRLGEGATFTFSLPRKGPSDDGD